MEIKNKWKYFGSSLLMLLATNTIGAMVPNEAPPAAASGGASTSPVAPVPTAPSVSTAVPNTTPAPTTPNTTPAAPPPSVKSPVAAALWPELLLPSSPPGDPIAGQAKSQVCAACHGADGNSTVAIWPKIAGQSDLYLVKSLIEFRKGDKGNRFEPSMYAMVQNLSDQDIADLAAYFASQTMSAGSASANLVALGEKIYRGGNLATGVPACAACHGARGEGNNLAKFPRLSGQQADYTLDQLKKFKAKTRKDDPNEIMQDISQRLSDEEMKAVSSYVSGLH